MYKSARATIYVDGVALPTGLSLNGGGVNLTTQVEIVCNFAQIPFSSKFGARYNQSAFLLGAIDEFRAYNRALTQNEVKYIADNY